METNKRAAYRTEKEGDKLKVFEAFSGIGAQHQALKNIGANFEIVGISEIDKFAIASYNAIHGEVPNYGDISKLEEKEISNIQMDIFTYSFPCQDISLAGHQKGLDKGSNTRSSLLWECEKVIKISRPKVLLMENVKNLVGKKNKPNFEKWLDLLESYGYTNYWEVLNAKDYGVPQNRERVFVVSILGNHKTFEFPKERLLSKTLTDLLSDVVGKKFYLSDKQIGRIKTNTYDSARNRIQEKEYCDTLCARDYKDPKCVKVKKIEDILEKSVDGRVLEPLKVRNATKKGYQEATNGDIIDLAYPDSTTRRGRVKKGYTHTITTNDNIGVLDGYRMRKLTPLECWRLMGFGDEEFYKAEKVNSNTQLYKQAGNSIVVDVLEGIFSEIIKSIQK